MKKTNSISLGLGSILALTIFALLLVSPRFLKGDEDDAGAVYTMTNDPLGNTVLVFKRSADGTLKNGGTFFTGGRGSGGKEPDFGLGNARALVLSKNNRFLFVVNPGSDDISAFAVSDDGLRLIDRQSSGGHQPISVTVDDNLLYVLNAGGNLGDSDNITGFTVRSDGRLTQLSGSTRRLSAPATGPAQIRFSPSGKVLVVTERNTNKIDTYTLGNDGRPTGHRVTLSDAETPFGFDFSYRNQLFVSDDFNDAPGAGALSSYLLSPDGGLHLVSSAVPAHESGACWVLVSRDGRFAYLANTVSSTISLYRIDAPSGRVTLIKAFQSLTGPTDMDFSRDGRFLYVLNPDQIGTNPGVGAFRVNREDGSLTPLPGVSGLPAFVDGLAAR